MQETLQHISLKLNPAKLAFFVNLGKFLGHIVSIRGLQANPNKIISLDEMRSTNNLKKDQFSRMGDLLPTDIFFPE